MSQVLSDDNMETELMRRLAGCLTTGTVNIFGDATPGLHARIAAGLILAAQYRAETEAGLSEGDHWSLQFAWDNKNGTFDVVTAGLEVDPTQSMMMVMTSTPIAIDEGWDPLVIDVTTFRPSSLSPSDRDAFEARAGYDSDDFDELDGDWA